ncbi:integrase [Citrobacter sp. Cy234]|uniref:integrase n=1 Tax=Citrobacter TaxID=544 RepID=UPI0013FD949E|nr:MULTISPECIES: integrase [Citrobacter]MBA8106849.1 integrase [Citrobacter sp. RHBSTW-00029]MDK2553587.1 integrase [Citrobacter youngae]MDM2727214.1 integrase [Citrobacter sp. Cy234]MDM2728869.1 integrase [Citrobacter sp. Cy234]NHM09032.1 integrase [Citrobacter youngae]
MHRIDTSTAQKDKFGAGKNGFTAGNPQTGTPATDLDNDYFDMLQEELAGVVEATGVNLDKSKHNQLLTALKALLLSRAHPFADIKADGPAAIAEALSNLGLGAGAPPIGIPFYWSLAAMPNTVVPEWSNMVFLKTNNTSFSAAEYPKLALMWPGLIIPEMRGEFIRIFDDGRGVNPVQPLLGWADSRLKEHTHVLPTGRMAVGVDDVSSTWVVVENDVATPKISTKTQSGGTGETAPRSIAFNCLVRAK